MAHKNNKALLRKDSVKYIKTEPVEVVFPEIATIPMFCEKCAKTKGPRTNTMYIAYGKSGKEIRVRLFIQKSIVDIKKRGITPHLVVNPILINKHQGIWEVETLCLVDMCGVRIFRSFENDRDFIFDEVEEEYNLLRLTTSGLKALYKLNDPDFHLNHIIATRREIGSLPYRRALSFK